MDDLSASGLTTGRIGYIDETRGAVTLELQGGAIVQALVASPADIFKYRVGARRCVTAWVTTANASTR